MAYTDFSLNDLRTKFNIKNQVKTLFQDVTPLAISESLQDSLHLATLLPIRSKKAKSELIVMPILIELMKKNKRFFTIYSGDTLVADKANGLMGECDFLLTKNTGSFDINTPIISIVEAKKNDIESGINQCAAQLYGAKIFNEDAGTKLDKIYGCVTTADNWKFMLLENNIIKIDKNIYYKSEVDKILGIFQTIINYYQQVLA